MFSRKVHDLRHFRFRDLVSVNAALADAVVMNVQHNSRRRLTVFVEEPLQHMDDEFHRRVVVIEQQDPIKTRLLHLSPGFGNDGGSRPARIAALVAVIVGRAWRGRAGVR